MRAKVRAAVCVMAPYAGAAAAVAAAYIFLRPLIKGTAPYLWFQAHVYYPCLTYIAAIFASPVFYAGVAVILLLERVFPAKPRQSVFSVGLAQDAVWLVLEACFEATVIVAYTGFLAAIYQQHLHSLTMGFLRDFPTPFKFMVGVLAADFLGWFHHWVRHKVPWFWEFHTVHHSQRELNMFSDLRYHVVEYLVSRTINTFPMLMVGIEPYHVALFAVFHTWFTHLYHSNIKCNFGVLRYVLVTPQSHRIHHSIEPRHRDKNFGVLFSVWDYLFGTQYRTYNEYPDTGIEDEQFPLEKSLKGLGLIVTPIRQMAYPFQSIARKISAKMRA